MKWLMISLCCLFLLSPTPLLAQNEPFTPCTGYSEGPATSMNAGPWANRLLIATSPDGLTWERTGQILTDQGDVPDAILTDEGEIRVYYITWCPSELQNRIAVASSQDGLTWEYRPITLTHPEGGPLGMPADPIIERADDGRYRLYFTSQIPPAQHGQSHSAISEDGYTFTYEGRVFGLDDQNTLDVNVLKIGETWHYFAGGIPGQNWHATSPDGLTFTQTEDFINDRIIMSNGLAVEGGYRYYGFQQLPGDASIVSFFTEDGINWQLEEGFRLRMDVSTGLEAEGVKDPAVVQLPDSTWLMVYVTTQPEYPLPNKGQ